MAIRPTLTGISRSISASSAKPFRVRSGQLRVAGPLALGEQPGDRGVAGSALHVEQLGAGRRVPLVGAPGLDRGTAGLLAGSCAAIPRPAAHVEAALATSGKYGPNSDSTQRRPSLRYSRSVARIRSAMPTRPPESAAR